jgi:hypothetical protein
MNKQTEKRIQRIFEELKQFDEFQDKKYIFLTKFNNGWIWGGKHAILSESTVFWDDLSNGEMAGKTIIIKQIKKESQFWIVHFSSRAY